jgi:hypothetical protein
MRGDSVTNSLTVTNASGSAAMRYAISSTATNTDTKGVEDQLTLVIKTVDPTTPGTPCDRALAAGPTSEILCFRASLPSTTAQAFATATTTATFTFNAEQTANNTDGRARVAGSAGPG